MTYCRRCVEIDEKRPWLYVVDGPGWDKTVQYSDCAETGPNRTGTDRSVASLAIIGRRGEYASSGGA